MGLWPTQGDEKRLLFSNDCRWRHRPPLCHLDRSAAQWRDLRFAVPSWKCFSTEESWAFGPPKVMKNGSCSATTVDGSTALPFVISTEAQRSGEICGSAVPSWKCFFDRGVMGLWPTQGDEKRLLFSNYSRWSTALPFVISTEAQRSGEICGPFLGMVFDRGIMGLWPTQGDEKRLLFSNNCRWKHRPPLCHLDRSAAQWRDLRFSGPFLEMCFRPRSHGPLAHPR